MQETQSSTLTLGQPGQRTMRGVRRRRSGKGEGRGGDNAASRQSREARRAGREWKEVVQSARA